MIEFEKYNWATDLHIKNELVHIFSHPITNISDKEIHKLILNSIDLTTLEGSDTNQKVTDLCNKALLFLNEQNTTVAAVCVYPVFAKLAKAIVYEKNIKIACVAGAFPSGQLPIHLKIEEVKYAIDEGANEIDTVISRKALLEGNYNQVFDEIAEIKSVCSNVNLKVILETGELQTNKNILIASELAIKAGADFIKTSTGKIAISATETAAYLMLTQIKEHYKKTGKMVGFKAAGGISEVEQAKRYLLLTHSLLGNEWLNNKYFRIGASRLVDTIYKKIAD